MQRGREGPAGGGGREDAAKIVDACPNAEWRLIFALARYAGLRVPSELFALKWDDVNWTESKMLIHASKTEHHEGKGSRWVPIFPELKPFLTECWESAERGKVHVISRYRDKNQNLRTQLGRIIRRAGLKTWPKLFQNLWASRATELAGEHPAHVAAAWLGHSTVIANKHYWQVTDGDFERATKGKELDLPAQIPALSAADSCGLIETAENENPQKRGKNRSSLYESTTVHANEWRIGDSNP